MAQPRFSIVIPTYRRPDQLTRCLTGIAQLDYPRSEFEVVVVSDEPGPATREIAQRFESSIHARAIAQEHAGPAQARNTGAAVSTGEFLLFLDDDCVPTTDWLLQWEAHAKLDPGCAAGGGTVNALAKNPYSSASHALVEFIHRHFHTGRADRQPFLASNNLCVPAGRFHAIKGFSTAFPIAAAEDRDFCDRWCARGWPMSRVERAVVQHWHELTLARFWRQHWNYGRGAYRLREERLARHQPWRFEPPGFYLDMVRYPWATEGAPRALLLSTLLCLSQVANAAGFLAEWCAPLLPHV